MSERQMLTITYKRLREIISGFNGLKDRKLPSLNVELRVAAQIRTLAGPIDDYATIRRKIIKEAQVMNATDDAELLEKKMSLQEEIQKLDEQTVEVLAPKKRLTIADLPVKGDDKDKNTAGLAGIMVALSPEFFDLPEEKDE